MEIFGERTARARKQHKCFWCAEPIECGETYTSWCCKERGEKPEIVKCHAECAEVWQNAAQDDWYYRECVGFGDHCRGCTCQSGSCECQKGEADE